MTLDTIRSIDCHMHTPLCGHAVGEPVAYVERAAQADIDLITFTCHIPIKGEKFCQAGIRMSEQDLPLYFDKVAQARELGESLGVEVLCGIEAEIYPDKKAMEKMDKLLQKHSFDFVLGSLHSCLPGYREWLARHGKVTDEAIVATYFEHLGEGLESGRYDSIAHPDVIRLYGIIKHFDPILNESCIREFLSRAAEANHCLEVNTSGLTKGDFVVHPDPLILDWAAELDIPFTLGSDAHAPESVGQHFPEVQSLLRSKGIEHLHFYHKRQRQRIATPHGNPDS